ncbi:colicin E3/pyocin S6 family cytotoxin [Testudinibacter sp. P80/BLE/0925]
MEDITGFSNLVRSKEKTPVQGGIKLRNRWKDKDGNIYEWGSQHGSLEKYNKHGNHY